MTYKVLYNPLAGTLDDGSFRGGLEATLPDGEFEYLDLTKLNYREFFASTDDDVILVGGDGTLNRFINDTADLTVRNRVYYYAAGSGNDFWHDLGRNKGDAPVEISEYIKDLPVVTVNGKSYKFINGVGFGIDGYCCEVGDRLKAGGKAVNYTGIAIKGLLFHYKPVNAAVTVDGVTQTYKKVWIAPTMNGRFYGGGMMPAPSQARLNAERRVTLCLMHRSGKLKTLMIFPSLFKGEHVKHEKFVKALPGKEITVKFDRPCALQIDGETISGVTEYTVSTRRK